MLAGVVPVDLKRFELAHHGVCAGRRAGNSAGRGLDCRRGCGAKAHPDAEAEQRQRQRQIEDLGGTFERGNWSLDPDPATSRRLVTGHAAFFEQMKQRIGEG